MPSWNLCGSWGSELWSLGLHRQHFDHWAIPPTPAFLIFNRCFIFIPLPCHMNFRVGMSTCAKKSFQGLDLDFIGLSVWGGLVCSIYDPDYVLLRCSGWSWTPGLNDPHLSLWRNQGPGRHLVLSGLLIFECGLTLILIRSASISFISIFLTFCIAFTISYCVLTKYFRFKWYCHLEFDVRDSELA